MPHAVVLELSCFVMLRRSAGVRSPKSWRRPSCSVSQRAHSMAAVASATDAMAAAKITDEPAAPASKSSHLAKQDLATMDPAKLNALSPEVISRQATINIGELLPPLCSGPSRSDRACLARRCCRPTQSLGSLLLRPPRASSACRGPASSRPRLALCRHHRPRGPRQVDRCEGHLGRARAPLPTQHSDGACLAAAWGSRGSFDHQMAAPPAWPLPGAVGGRLITKWPPRLPGRSLG